MSGTRERAPSAYREIMDSIGGPDAQIPGSEARTRVSDAMKCESTARRAPSGSPAAMASTIASCSRFTADVNAWRCSAFSRITRIVPLNIVRMIAAAIFAAIGVWILVAAL